MRNEHTFVELFFRMVCDRPARVGRNVHEGVLIANIALHSKIHLKNYKLRSIFRAEKQSGPNPIIDIHRRICFVCTAVAIIKLMVCLNVRFDLCT